MQRRLVFLFVCFAILFLSCGKKKEEVKQEEVIKIGAVLPLSGDVAVYGNNTKQGIDLAVDEINRLGGINNKKIKIIYEDSKAQPEIGVSAIQKLINVDKVPAVIDNSVSSVALAMVPIAEKNSVVLLSTGSTNPKLSGISPYFFRIWNSDALEGKWTARYTFDSLNIKIVSIIYVNNDYGKGLDDVFTKEFQSKGGKIELSESFSQGETKFSIVLTKIKNTPSQGIYIVGYPKEIGQILRQMRQLGIKLQPLGTVTMEDPQIISIAGNAAEGVIYPFPLEPDKNDTSVQTFYKNFEARYGKKPGITCDVGYDAVKMLSWSINKVNSSLGNDIKNGLRQINNFHGASGIMEFDEAGDVNKPMKMKTIKKGSFSLFQNK